MDSVIRQKYCASQELSFKFPIHGKWVQLRIQQICRDIRSGSEIAEKWNSICGWKYLKKRVKIR